MLLTILLAVFVVLSILILLKFFKHIFKALFLIGALLSIIVVVFGILVLLDLNDLRMNIGKQPSRIMYADGQNVLLAFSIDPVALQESQGSEILSGIESIPVSGLQDSYQICRCFRSIIFTFCSSEVKLSREPLPFFIPLTFNQF